MEKLYTVDDVAQMTGLTSRTIRNYLADGRLCGRKIGSQWRFTEAEVESLFSDGSAHAESERPATKPLEGAIAEFMTPQPRESAVVCAVIDCPAESEAAIAPVLQQLNAQVSELGGENVSVGSRFDSQFHVARFTILAPLELATKLIKTIRRSGTVVS